jgi:hypothetical protein
MSSHLLRLHVFEICSIAQKDDEVEFECKVKEEDEDSDVKLKDKIDFKITTGTRGLGVKVEYEQEVKTGDVKSETETEYEIIFDRIVEYSKAVDGDGDEAYDWDTDIIVQTVSLNNWESFSEVTDAADGVMSYFSASSLDGHVTFKFTVSRADQGEKVTANKMKIDFSLVDFPWVGNDTHVALLSTVESKQKVDVEDADDEMEDGGLARKAKKAKDVIISFDEAQDTVGIIPFGEYTWDESAEVIEPAASANETTTETQRSGVDVAGVPTTISVVATSPTFTDTSEITKERRIAFSFIRDAAISASNIYWDPEAGVGYSDNSSDNSSGGHVGRLGTSLLFLSGALSWMFLVAF